LESTNENLIDFVGKCLRWRAEERMTPEEALQHPWLLDVLKKKESIPQLNVKE